MESPYNGFWTKLNRCIIVLRSISSARWGACAILLLQHTSLPRQVIKYSLAVLYGLSKTSELLLHLLLASTIRICLGKRHQNHPPHLPPLFMGEAGSPLNGVLTSSGADLPTSIFVLGTSFIEPTMVAAITASKPRNIGATQPSEHCPYCYVTIDANSPSFFLQRIYRISEPNSESIYSPQRSWGQEKKAV